jgi:hypothetical protein
MEAKDHVWTNLWEGGAGVALKTGIMKQWPSGSLEETSSTTCLPYAP